MTRRFTQLAPSEHASSSRTRFMVETLTNLKNNKVKRTAPQAAVETDRLKKFVANLGKTHAGTFV